MELSLFSRDVIAMSAGIALSHNMFDAAVFLGICDKIVPGLLMAALAFGHLPAIFIPGRPDAERPAERREGEDPPALRRGQGRPRRAARGRSEILSRPRHLHLLRHRQHQPDDDGDHGPAPARRVLRQPQHAAARRADPRGGEAGARHHRARQRIHAGRRGHRRARHRQRRRRPARHRRLDQPHAASRRHRRAPPASSSPGTISPTSPRSCRCSRASIRTASPT